GEDRRRWRRRDYLFSRTMSTACVVDDVVYISEITGVLHCLDAQTGKQFWEFDTKAGIWGSPLYADGKVFLGTDEGKLFVFRHDPKPEVFDVLDFGAVDRKDARARLTERHRELDRKYLMQTLTFDSPIRVTPTVAGGVLYVATEKTLYAIGKK